MFGDRIKKKLPKLNRNYILKTDDSSFSEPNLISSNEESGITFQTVHLHNLWSEFQSDLVERFC